MRTPGNDVEFITGYLLSESVITSMDEIEEIDFSAGLAPDQIPQHVAAVRLRPGTWSAEAATAHPSYTSSSVLDLWHRGDRRSHEDLRLPA